VGVSVRRSGAIEGSPRFSAIDRKGRRAAAALISMLSVALMKTQSA